MVKGRYCQYGVLTVRCGERANTKRQRPGPSTELWDVCDFHAGVLDRLRRNIKDHAELLSKLADVDS